MVKRLTLVGVVCLPSEAMFILLFWQKKVLPQLHGVLIMESSHVMCTLFPEQLAGPPSVISKLFVALQLYLSGNVFADRHFVRFWDFTKICTPCLYILVSAIFCLLPTKLLELTRCPKVDVIFLVLPMGTLLKSCTSLRFTVYNKSQLLGLSRSQCLCNNGHFFALSELKSQQLRGSLDSTM